MADEYMRPGWYPDPDGVAGERWWNGTSWSDTKRGGAAPAAASPTVPVYAPPVAPSVGAAPVIYSAENPAPQRPDPYAARPAAAVGALTQTARENRNATIGLVLGIVAIFGLSIAGVVGVVFSILGIQRGRQMIREGKPNSTFVMAIVGLGLNVFALLFGLITIVIAVVATLSTTYTP